MQPTLFLNHGCGPFVFLEGGLLPEGSRELELTPLHGDDVLIDGQSCHKISGDPGALDRWAAEFDRWLCGEMMHVQTRNTSLLNWAKAPGAVYSQPQEHHLMPLMIADGAATVALSHHSFHGHALGKPISSFRFD